MNSSKIAIVDNLIEGDYTFILKIWTSNSSNYDSQSTTQVLVRRNQKPLNNDLNIFDNRLKLDLNTNPLKFLEIERTSLITRIQLILKQSLLIKNPKMIILKQEILKKYQKSGISIEFYVIDEYNNKVVDSGLIMRLLSKLIKSKNIFNFNKISSDLTVFDNQYVFDIIQTKCLNNCSDHGYCDTFTFKCVCDRYWMMNIYKYYLANTFDETYGNNCGKHIIYLIIFLLINLSYLLLEWNIIFFILGFIFTCFTTALISYLTCCCCCRRNNKNRYDTKDHDEINKKKRKKESFCKKLFCCLCRCCCRKKNINESNDLNKKTNEIKYSLLGNKDDSFSFPGS